MGKSNSIYKVGDRVVVVSNTCSHGLSIGEITTLKSRKTEFDSSSDRAWTNTSNSCYIQESNFKLAIPMGKVKFLLKYDLESDPVEEFETLAKVKERIEELVKDKDKNSLKLDSMVVYEINSVKKITVEISAVIKGI